ncbi:MAG: fabG 19 [Ilumatobacteraceae bacterium]|nr:fabG 19 [Ilumatobacteraceae bacterium]MCU1388965.1 fabG 19 [Ilumatobacteraceae bacterium]
MDIAIVRAMVVGGASGMARATAERIAAAGGKVAILDRPGSDGAAVAAAFGGLYFDCDITDYTGTEAVITAAVEALGGLDAAVNTAGGGVAAKTIGKDGSPHDLDAFRSVIDLNLVATFNLNRLQAFHMSKNEPNEDGERGVIINTSSIAAYEGQIGQVAYAASKAGIAGMSLTMARDLGSLGIRVNAIAPSLFDTGITKGLPDEFKAPLTKDAAFPKRMGHPDEYARLAVAIIDNPMLNGGTIRLDAGQRFAPR